MIMIDQGRMFIRRIKENSAIIGIISVPVSIQAEQLYPVILSDHLGIFVVDTPRAIDYDQRCPLAECDMNSLLHLPVFKKYPEKNVFDAFLRDTDIPDAPEGFKWVLAAGASKSHDGPSRMISANGKSVVVEDGEICAGDSISNAARLPIWGNQDNPHCLATTVVYSSIPAIREQSRQDPDFLEFIDRMEALSPAKSCYSKDEKIARDTLAGEIMKDMIDAKDNNKTKVTP